MPTYDFICECGEYKEIYLPVEIRDAPQICECGRVMKRKLSLPQPAIIKQTGSEMALNSLNSGISAAPGQKKMAEAAAVRGLTSPKRVIGKGMSFKKRGK